MLGNRDECLQPRIGCHRVAESCGGCRPPITAVPWFATCCLVVVVAVAVAVVAVVVAVAVVAVVAVMVAWLVYDLQCRARAG